MNTANDITEELHNMGSTLAGVSRAMPYAVPAGYFNQLPGDALNAASGAYDADIQPGWGKAQVFTTPQGYFEGITDTIVAAAKAGNSPVAITKDTPFAVPAGYFNALPAQMLAAAKEAQPAKKKPVRIPLGQQSFRGIRWAAAAVMLICIGFGGYLTFNPQPDQTDRMLASVPNTDIQDYLHSTYVFDVPRIINNDAINTLGVDNKDIIQYLNETGWDMAE